MIVLKNKHNILSSSVENILLLDDLYQDLKERSKTLYKQLGKNQDNLVSNQLILINEKMTDINKDINRMLNDITH